MGEPNFKKYEIILCQHRDQLFEAKILEYRYNNDHEYLVHYQGWAKRHNEWVGEEVMFKLNASNKAKQKAMAAKQLSPSKGRATRSLPSTTSSKSRASSTPRPSSSRKRKSSPWASSAHNGSYNNGYANDGLFQDTENAFTIPDALHSHLADGWDKITQSNPCLVKLPAETTVKDILTGFAQYMQQNVPSISLSEIKNNTTDQLEALFNTLLEKSLLINWERSQHKQLIETYPGVDMSSLYGSHHLLRLFDKLTHLMDKWGESTKSLQAVADPLFEYLLENEKMFFKNSDYVVPPTNYKRSEM